ncbi:hypothetical protein FACS189452_07990 [Bacteroidia bacterium]|nr:hypothetical protein FACS189452_07990 [Bacteroidia bacterium]GHT80517.1 hypothetical protein FACS189467_2870 [Bacteroidia bacterium]
MKKIVEKTSKAALLMCAVALAGMTGCSEEEKGAVPAVILQETAVEIGVGNTYPAVAWVEPANADQSVTWTSSNEAVATVDEDGLITGVASGKAIITVTSVSNPAVKAEIEVTVKDLAGDIVGTYAGAGYVGGQQVAPCNVVLTFVDPVTVRWDLNIVFPAEAGIPIPEFEMKAEKFLLNVKDTVVNEITVIKIYGQGQAEKLLGTDPFDGTPDVTITGTIVDGILNADLEIGGSPLPPVSFQGQKQ